MGGCTVHINDTNVHYHRILYSLSKDHSAHIKMSSLHEYSFEVSIVKKK